MRNTNEQSLKQVIEEMMQRNKLKGKLTEVRIQECWEKVMGPTIAQRTLGLALKNKALYVKVNSAPLKHELSFNLPRLVQLINEEMGENVITEVILS
jgi:predicted nucleic acid-binding Zn ribbon protein